MSVAGERPRAVQKESCDRTLGEEEHGLGEEGRKHAGWEEEKKKSTKWGNMGVRITRYDSYKRDSNGSQSYARKFLKDKNAGKWKS